MRLTGSVGSSFLFLHIREPNVFLVPGAQTTEGQSNYFWQGVIRELEYLYIFTLLILQI